MDTIINFLEQYWGLTLFGGVSVGTIVTFTITQIKVILKDKVKSKHLDSALSTVDKLCLELDARNKAAEEKNAQLQTELNAKTEEMIAKEQYFEKVQAATFQAISYLVIASKLPTEDKIALQEKFTSVINDKATQYKNMLADEVAAVKAEVTNNIIPDATATVTETVEETKSLLDKYTKEG